jgi:hypothetical protein
MDKVRALAADVEAGSDLLPYLSERPMRDHAPLSLFSQNGPPG